VVKENVVHKIVTGILYRFIKFYEQQNVNLIKLINLIDFNMTLQNYGNDVQGMANLRNKNRQKIFTGRLYPARR
jgi:hypothetical protein